MPITNFPKQGGDKKVSLANSQYDLFPLGFAEDLKKNYPSIWSKGGNIQGNDTYRVILDVRKSGGELSANEEKIVRMREAWCARHYEDFRIAGVIAQVKWHMVGSRGVNYMKNLINEEKQKVDEKRKEREYRRFESFEIRASEEEGKNGLFVEGYALTFDEPTVLFESQGIQYREVIDRNALTNADMSDVIFNYDHQGKVMARTRNKTLELMVDQKGLFIRADLGGTEAGRKLYEEIRGGYVDKMSFSFISNDNAYDRETRTRRIKGIKRLIDVSAVSVPAYQSTSISARSFFEAEAEMERKVDTERRTRLQLQSFILGGMKNETLIGN